MRMAGEIITGGQHDVAVASKHGIGEIIKPMIREIHLFDTWIAGTALLEDKALLKALKAEEELVLRREENEFDSMAILVLDSGERKLGYVPEKDNIIFARLMDAGKSLKAKVRKTEDDGSGIRVGIGIYLVDL